MWLLDKLFKNKKKPVNVVVNNTEDDNYDFEIENITWILGNLGLLNRNEIVEKMIDYNHGYDTSILARMFVHVSDNDYELIRKYYPVFDLGFGELRLKELVNELKLVASNEVANGKNNYEIVEILIKAFYLFLKEFEI